MIVKFKKEDKGYVAKIGTGRVVRENYRFKEKQLLLFPDKSFTGVTEGLAAVHIVKDMGGYCFVNGDMLKFKKCSFDKLLGILQSMGYREPCAVEMNDVNGNWWLVADLNFGFTIVGIDLDGDVFTVGHPEDDLHISQQYSVADEYYRRKGISSIKEYVREKLEKVLLSYDTIKVITDTHQKGVWGSNGVTPVTIEEVVGDYPMVEKGIKVGMLSLKNLYYYDCYKLEFNSFSSWDKDIDVFWAKDEIEELVKEIDRFEKGELERLKEYIKNKELFLAKIGGLL